MTLYPEHLHGRSPCQGVPIFQRVHEWQGPVHLHEWSFGSPVLEQALTNTYLVLLDCSL